MATPQVDKWKKVTDIKIDNLHCNKTWTLTPHQHGMQVIPSKLIYKNQFLANSTLNKRKCQFICQGFQQKHSIEYMETYAPMVHQENLWLIIALATAFDLELHAMDVVTEEIYIEQPEGYVDPEHPDWAPYKWNKSINTQLCLCGFVPLDADPCIYMLHKSSDLLAIIAIHVDDCMIAAHKGLLAHTKAALTDKFQMQDLGEVSSILGMEIIHNQSAGQLYIIM